MELTAYTSHDYAMNAIQLIQFSKKKAVIVFHCVRFSLRIDLSGQKR